MYPRFQSTLPRRERHLVRQRWDKSRKFQSTLPRRERLEAVVFFLELVVISIHAPAKGATNRYKNFWLTSGFQSTLPRRERRYRLIAFIYIIIISIHAPAKGATTETIWYCSIIPDFNPRSREGSDKMVEHLQGFSSISIHAPAKGATAIFHKIINLYCETSTNTTRINSLNINKNYISRIKASILNYFRVRITL